ncbi:MAG TPA: zinc dependent phospholipase C family protein [Terracidiphilus sp.]|jgi:hypothetical protein|nr:zinc dependent phospholipase C family protein [Terracidiphilus sp.]
MPAFAYSLLTHEQLIDLTWDDSIVPLLLSRYPGLTPAQLDEARSYAYGGCVIQDIGYYPFGQMSISNLTHYVRSGDFVMALFRNAKNADELAFAVGALSHYIGDSVGHPLATNLAVPVEFPRLRAEYGRTVSYAQGRHQHVQAEFAFDINEIAHHRMAPLKYLKHIGMNVSMRQLSLAFYQTYGLSDRFSGTRKRGINVTAYRFAVRSFIPRIAYAITLIHRRHEPLDVATPEARELHDQVTALALENNWATYRRHAGIGTWTLAGLIVILPKIGPLKLTAIKGPTPATETDYVHSLSLSTAALRRMLVRFTPPEKRKRAQNADANGASSRPSIRGLDHSAQATNVSETGPDPRHPLANRDLDTGNVVAPGGYSLTDATYASLLHSLTRQPTVPIPPGIKEDILAFYSNLDAPFTTKKYPRHWEQVQADLVTLKTMPTSPVPEPFPTYDEGEGQQ